MFFVVAVVVCGCCAVGGSGAAATVPLALCAAGASVDEGVVRPGDELGQVLADFTLAGAQRVTGQGNSNMRY